MDLIKIGKYIAEKRKALGLTQKQLAEKLNMSDKSVSKWERGICLPDVSIYMELCSILRISINEFLTGEDIGAENVIEKSDSNLIQITKESKKKQKNLKTILAVVTVFAVIVSAILGTLFFHKLIQLPVIWFGEFLTDCRKPVVCYHCHNFIHSYLRTETPRSAR